MARRRLTYALCGLAVTALGLAWRSGPVSLSPFVAKYGADALWALLVFLGARFLLPARPVGWAAGSAAAFSLLIELSQLYHAPWIDAVRQTRLGALALGDTFAWGDLAAYLAGIAFGAVADTASRPS